MKRTPNGALRIIGGNWRSRKVSFPDREAIRPTPDRVRETLFNWLQWDLNGARCLELYAGSGILGMEALSRGAGFVTFVERDAATTAAIVRNLGGLGATPASFECITMDVESWLRNPPDTGPADIVFLDPPFSENGIERVLPQLAQVMNDSALVYVETPRAITADRLPERFGIHRQKRAGQVHYALLTWQRED